MAAAAGWLFTPDQSGPEFVWVRDKADFPDAVAGVITLADARTYFLTTTIDLAGDRIVAGVNTAIIGGSSQNCGLLSTGLGATALITTTSSLPLRNIFLTADIVLDADGVADPAAAMDWTGVNFIDCADCGDVKDYSNLVVSGTAFLASGDLTVKGTIGTVAFNDTLFVPPSGTSGLVIDAAASITRRMRINYCSMVVASGATGVTADPSSFPNETFILDTVNFSGAGTFLDGVDATDNASLISNSAGVTNSADVAQYFVIGNATETTITTQDVWVKALGTTAAGPFISKFTITNNRATYVGALDVFFKVTAVGSLTDGALKTWGMGIAKNGTILPSSETRITSPTGGKVEGWVTQAIVEMVSTDYVELFIVNRSDTSNGTVTELNLIVERAQ